jgi:hypothetical protein
MDFVRTIWGSCGRTLFIWETVWVLLHIHGRSNVQVGTIARHWIGGQLSIILGQKGEEDNYQLVSMAVICLCNIPLFPYTALKVVTSNLDLLFLVIYPPRSAYVIPEIWVWYREIILSLFNPFPSLPAPFPSVHD